LRNGHAIESLLPADQSNELDEENFAVFPNVSDVDCEEAVSLDSKYKNLHLRKKD